MLSALRLKQLFVALRLHFTSDYDYFRYNGKTNIQEVKPNELAYKTLAARLVNEERAMKFILANFVKSFAENSRIDSWIGNYKSREAFDAIYDYDDEFARVSYTLTQLKNEHGIKNLLDKESNLIYKLYLRKKVSLVHLCVVYRALRLDRYWDWSKDPLMNETGKFFQKLSPFLPTDDRKIREILLGNAK